MAPINIKIIGVSNPFAKSIGFKKLSTNDTAIMYTEKIIAGVVSENEKT